jgi:hypothetical protein
MQNNLIILSREAVMKKMLMLILAFSILLLPAACRKAPSEGEVEGKIFFTVGEVTLNGRAAMKDASVRPGDVLETKNNSTCEIIIAEKNILMIAANTRLTYNLRPGDGRLELSHGSLGALLRNKLPFGEFRIITRTVTASIRGTAFYMAAETDEKTYACVCNGTIRFKPDGPGNEKTVAASHHTAFTYTREKGAIAVEKAGLLYHTDTSMDKLAAAIGETIDWTHTE